MTSFSFSIHQVSSRSNLYWKYEDIASHYLWWRHPFSAKQLHGCNEEFLFPTTQLGFSETALLSLIELGYACADVVYTMTLWSGNVCDATKWLIENGSVEVTKEVMTSLRPPVTNYLHHHRSDNRSSVSWFNITDLSVAFDIIQACLIDDYANDCDSPLAEVVFEKLRLRQRLSSTTGPGSLSNCLWLQSGSAYFRLKCDYYNRSALDWLLVTWSLNARFYRMLSLLEPFQEQWRCGLSWKHWKSSTKSNGGKWEVKVQGSDKWVFINNLWIILIIQKLSDLILTSL